MKLIGRVALVACLAASHHAGAEDTPALAPAPAPAQLTLKQGGLFVQLDLELDVAKEAVGKPFSIAPDVSVGATSDLTLSLIHSTFGTTGFRGGSGFGLCVTGANNACPHPYNNVGAEAVYSLVAGDAALAAVAGVYSLDLADSWVDLKLGAKAKFTSGPLSLTVTPSVYVALDHRDAAMAPNIDQLYLPIGLALKVSAALAVGVGSGIKGPLANFSGFGDKFTVPFGANAVVTIDPHVAVGGSFTFGKLTGGPAIDPATTGADFRAIHVWLNYAR